MFKFSKQYPSLMIIQLMVFVVIGFAASIIARLIWNEYPHLKVGQCIRRHIQEPWETPKDILKIEQIGNQHFLTATWVEKGIVPDHNPGWYIYADQTRHAQLDTIYITDQNHYSIVTCPATPVKK
jgi:hypothetical protein